ncbi:MAG TPA: rod shape-determining protein MreC [Kiritimatiellia bacterium]|nr:rod shape-determining protein MreC [Kiritimatiellia bacterium]
MGVVVLVLLNVPDPVGSSIRGGFREALSPLQVALANAWERVSEQVQGVQRMPTLAVEVARLQVDIEQLQTQLALYSRLERENEELAGALAFARRAPYEVIPVRIIARSRDGWWQTLTVDKGTDHGVREQQAVITPEGLIGKTVHVSRRSSLVLLISDPSLRVSVRIPQAGAFGILSGRGPSWDGEVVCRMEFINRRSGVRVGDEVVTSGLGGVFPPDLVVGTVRSLVTDPSGLFQTALVRVRADIADLRIAFVVSDSSPPVLEEGVAR